ncbi:MAG TPA: cell division protein FtsZ [Polyangiales bacterium]|nr:cell division protein FtsZ [Polyangiales bacterium]
MGISIDFADDAELQAKIKVVGVGGAGGNAINTMIHSGLDGVEFFAANTDTQALASNAAPGRIQLGINLTRGLGAGATPDVGRKAALEDVQRIAEALSGADMVFVTAGMGGGTGTGAAPIIAQIARDQGALTVGVVTKPFQFEGRRRMKNALAGLDELRQSVDTIITIPNEKLLTVADDDMSMLEAFRRADDVLLQAVRGISDLIVRSGVINVDFADVRTIMSCTGKALMGTGYGRGVNRALEAADVAINSPLLDDISIAGATGILINFTAGPDVKLKEVREAASMVQEAAHEDANIIFGLVTDANMEDVVKVTVIATGFDNQAEEMLLSTPATTTRHQHAGHQGHVTGHSQLARNAAQQALARGTGAPSTQAMPPPPPGLTPRQQAQAPAPRTVVARQSRAPFESPSRPSTMPEVQTARAFGPAAMMDEAVLDIPAYLRRAKQQ